MRVLLAVLLVGITGCGGQEALTLKGHSDAVKSVSFSPDGTRIVSAGSSGKDNRGEIKVRDAQTGQETLTLEGHSDSVTSVSFSSDGKRIVSSSSDKMVKVWDISPLDTSK
jgi:WD40 repeat protein